MSRSRGLGLVSVLLVGLMGFAFLASTLGPFSIPSSPLRQTDDLITPTFIPMIYLPFMLKGAQPTPTLTGTATPMPTATTTTTPTITPTPTLTGTATSTCTPTSIPTAITTPTATRTPSRPLAAFGVQALGEVSNDLAWTRVQEAGIRWVRLVIGWGYVEPNEPIGGQHSYNWGGPDYLFGKAANAGLTPMVVIGGNPPWASSYDCEPTPDKPLCCGPIHEDHLEDFAAFVHALAERYDGDDIDDAPGAPVVEHWEFYNEPDYTDRYDTWRLGGCWGGDADEDGVPDPQEYAEMLRYVWPAIHNASSEAKVLMGALAFTANERQQWGSAPFNEDFLRQMLAHNEPGPCEGGPCFDVMNYHFYVDFAERFSPPNMIGKALVYRSELANWGLGDKPFICSEVGLPNAPSPGYSDELQSRYVVQVFARGMGAGDYGVDFEALAWFTLVEFIHHGGRNYGLLNSDLSRRPAYWTYKTLTDELAEVQYAHPLNSTDIDDTSGLEGYVFTNPGGSKKMVLWCTSETAGQRSFPVSQNQRLRVVQKQKYNENYPNTEDPAAVAIISDGGDADLDGRTGWIGIQITPSPIYVEARP